MTEILVDVDFGHPPERVWRALTDRRLLSQWFMQTDLEPHEGRGFRLVPEDLPGFAGPIEGELIELAAPRRMVMLWRAAHMHCRVVWELEPTENGCRLKVSQTGFLGVKGSQRRKELQRTYAVLLTERLPAILDRLASGEGSLLADLVPAAPVAPVAPAAPRGATPLDPKPEPLAMFLDEPTYDDEPSRKRGVFARLRLSHQRRGQLLAVAGAAVLAVLTMAVISSLGVRPLLPSGGASPDGWTLDPPGYPSTTGAPMPLPASPGAGPGVTGGLGGPGITLGPSGSVPGVPVPSLPGTALPPAPPPPPPPGDPGGIRALQAGYRTVKTDGAGYSGEIKVRNVGNVAVSDWVVTMTIQPGARLQNAQGASQSANGAVITFTPENPAVALDPGESVVVVFKIKSPGSQGPVDCEIDNQACGGV